MTHNKLTASFPVRYYECDAYNHVNHANYIRYMSEAAFHASDMVGYTDHKLRQMGHVWLAREHEVEFLAPLKFGDTVTVDTWVADFRRVRSKRMYELHNGTDLAARAWTDWVYVDRQTGRPVTIPDQQITDFQTKNGSTAPAPAREKFPAPPPPPNDMPIFQISPEWRDIDPMGHVNNAAYLSYIENGTWQLSESLGWPPQRLIAENFGIVARRYRIEYLQPAAFDDSLLFSTWVSNRKRATAVRHYAIHRAKDNAQLVRARALWVWINLATGKPIRIPPHFMADFSSNFTSQE